MTAFGPHRADDVLAQCQSAGEAIGGAFSSAFGGDFRSSPTTPAPVNLDELPEGLAGGGLVFGFMVDATRCVAILSAATGLLPDWCTEPDLDGAQRLNQLGSDLATALLPPETVPKFAGVVFHRDVAAVLRDSQPTRESVCLALEITKDDAVAQLSMIWPVANFVDPIGRIVVAASDAADESDKPDGAETTAPAKLPKHRRLIYRDLEDGIRQLPAYAQSLLRVQVPVTVTLATAKTPVSKVLEMGPGTILQFKKACDSNLSMEVGRQTVAEGEAVKVGDKFGLWITSMTMPGERFSTVAKNATAKPVK